MCWHSSICIHLQHLAVDLYIVIPNSLEIASTASFCCFYNLRICHMRRGCMRVTVCTCSDTQLCFTTRHGCWQRTRLVACLSFSHMRLGCCCGQLFIHLRSPRSFSGSLRGSLVGKLKCFCQSPAGITFSSCPSSAESNCSNNQTLCIT